MRIIRNNLAVYSCLQFRMFESLKLSVQIYYFYLLIFPWAWEIIELKIIVDN
ncbi:hypothetical protein PL10110_560014 [Planktothrix agardhii]|nr:hypothetical protein PL10110_560014 [Planktothrix agardhii]